MNDDPTHFVRGFADLAASRAGIAWSLAGGGGLIVEAGKAAAVGADEVGNESDESWSFYTPLEGDPLASAAVFRHITVEAAEGMIVCTAQGSGELAGHGGELTDGFRRAGGEEIPFEETLISTQYGPDGDPTRFGLELWPEDADQSSRAAATRVSASLLSGARNGEVWAGAFRCHADGTEGAGTYLLWRA
jgi:hypothetical protein